MPLSGQLNEFQQINIAVQPLSHAGYKIFPSTPKVSLHIFLVNLTSLRQPVI